MICLLSEAIIRFNQTFKVSLIKIKHGKVCKDELIMIQERQQLGKKTVLAKNQ